MQNPGGPVARLFSANLGLVIEVPHCCYVLLSTPILPLNFEIPSKKRREDGGRQQHMATVRDFYHQTYPRTKEPSDRGPL